MFTNFIYQIRKSVNLLGLQLFKIYYMCLSAIADTVFDPVHVLGMYCITDKAM